MAVNNGLFRYSQRRKDDPLAPVAPYKVSGSKSDQEVVTGQSEAVSNATPTSAVENTQTAAAGTPTDGGNNVLAPYVVSKPYQTTKTGEIGAIGPQSLALYSSDNNSEKANTKSKFREQLITDKTVGNGGGAGIPLVPKETNTGGDANNNGGEDTSTVPTAWYEAKDFDDWWNHYFGSTFDWKTGSMGEKPEWMTDADWKLGQELYNIAKQIRDQMAAYEAAMARERESTQRQLQLGGAVYEKLQKYLPIQLRAQGLGNLGISQSAMVRSHANMANYMGDVEEQSADRMLQLYLDQSQRQGELNKETLEAYSAAREAFQAEMNEPLSEILYYAEAGYTPEQLRGIYESMEGVNVDVAADIEKFLDEYETQYKESAIAEIEALIESGASVDDIKKTLAKYSFITGPEAQAFIDKAEERDALAYGNAVIDGALYYQVDGTVYSYDNDELSLSGLKALLERFGDGGDLKASDSRLNALKRRIAELEADPEAKKADEDAKYAAGESERVLSGEQGIKYDGVIYYIAQREHEYIDSNDMTLKTKMQASTIDTSTSDFINALSAEGYVYVNDSALEDGVTIPYSDTEGNIKYKYATYYGGKWYHSKKPRV